MVSKMSISETDKECPLCMETLDWDDLGFYPCSCGYQICRFCWHRLRTDENGLCPACRQTFPDIPVSFNPEVSAEELKKQKKRNKERNKTNKEQVKAQDLATLRVVQKNLVFVIGLSSRLTQEDLKKEFAHFGKIIKFVHNKSTAYVTYSKPEEAIRAIRTLNASAAQESAAQHLQLQQLTNGTNNIITTGPTGAATTANIVTNPISVPVPPNRLKASLGTTKYCNHFLRSQQCPKVGECMYLHEIAEAEASFTKEQMQAGKHVEYEKKLMDSYFVKSEVQNINNNNNNNNNNSNNLIRQQQQQLAMHNQLPVTQQLPNQQSQSKPSTIINAVPNSNITVSKPSESIDVFKESNPCGDTTVATTTSTTPITSTKAWMNTTISLLNSNSNSNSSSSSSSSSSNNINNNINNNNTTTFHQNANEEGNLFKRSPILHPGKGFQPLQNQTLNTLFGSNINGFDTSFHEKLCGINKVININHLDSHPLQHNEKTTRSLKNTTLESPFLNSLRIQAEQPKTEQSAPLDLDSEDDGLDFDPISVSTIGLRDMLMDQQVQQQQALHTMNLSNHNHRLNYSNSILDYDSQTGSALGATLGLTGGNGLSQQQQQQQQQVTWQNLRNLFPNVNITFNARPMNQTSNEFSHHPSYLMPTTASTSGDPWPSSAQGTANSLSTAGSNLNHNHDFFSLASNSLDDFGSLANSHNISSAFNVLQTSQQHRDQQLLQQQQQRYLRHLSSNSGSNNQSSNMNDSCLTSSVWQSRNN